MSPTDSGEAPLWFWELLASAGRSLRTLSRALEQLSRERLQDYLSIFEEAKHSVDPYYDWDAAAPHISEWPSEDGADDFSAWVVMQGRDFFERVRSCPQDVQKHLDFFGEWESWLHPEFDWDEAVDRDDYRGYQRADSIAVPIYRLRFEDDGTPAGNSPIN